MGSVYRTCPNCGEQIGGSWDREVDDEDSAEPFALRLKLIEHGQECRGSFRSGAAVAFGLMGMFEAIRSTQRHGGEGG